jgi:Rrf2 family transcriptional regulator, cysteine metabolism repressor
VKAVAGLPITISRASRKQFSFTAALAYRAVVKLSVKSDYAARAVLALARQHHTGAALRVETIAQEQGIPANYLVQILIELKGQQLVRSLRGKEGGYLLARAPGEITMGDILRCIHGEVFDSSALRNPNCPAELREAWKQLQTTMNETADAITFQQLLDRSADKEKMYYI